MANQYLTADQAIEKANEFFNKGDLSMALQHLEYSNRLKRSEQATIGIILIKLVDNKDLKMAMQNVNSLPSIRYTGEIFFKAYKAVIGLYYYYDQYETIAMLNNTRHFIENYIATNFVNLQKQIGEENANTIRIMLLKVLLSKYNSILHGQVCVGEEQLPDTYTSNTIGTTKDYGYSLETKLTTTIETHKNSRSIFIRNIDFIGESRNELNFQIRCKEIIDEIHKTDPKYTTSKSISIPNLNYLLGGYLKYKTYKKMQSATKKKRFSLGLMFCSGGYFILLFPIKSVISGAVPPSVYFMQTTAGIILCISILSYIKSLINERKYEIGEYEIDQKNCIF